MNISLQILTSILLNTQKWYWQVTYSVFFFFFNGLNKPFLHKGHTNLHFHKQYTNFPCPQPSLSFILLVIAIITLVSWYHAFLYVHSCWNKQESCGQFLKRWEYQITWPAYWETCMLVKKQQLELDMEQNTGSKLGKEYIKAVYCHPVSFTYIESTSCEMLGWMKHKLESRLTGEISMTSDMQMTPPLWQKEKRNERGFWWRWKKRVKKQLKINIQNTKIMTSSPITSL